MKNFDSCLGNGRKESCAIIGLLSWHFKWPNLDHLSRRRPLKSLEPRLLKAACLHSTRTPLTQGWKGLACFFFFSLQTQLARQPLLVICKLLCSVFLEKKKTKQNCSQSLCSPCGIHIIQSWQKHSCCGKSLQLSSQLILWAVFVLMVAT